MFRYCEGIIDLDAEIADRAFNLVPEEKLDGPKPLVDIRSVPPLPAHLPRPGSPTTPQSPKDRHQQRDAECWDGGRNDYVLSPKAACQQHAAQKRPGDSAYTSRAQRPARAGRADGRRINQAR